MKNYLFAALFLGSYVALISSQSESFDFIDSQGRCWRCESGSCIPCPASMLPKPSPEPVPVPRPNRTPQDGLCIQPTQVDCDANPGARFPTPDINMFWDCGDNFRMARRCDCDNGFDANTGQCVHSDDLTTIGCNDYWNTEIFKCDLPTAAPTEAPTEAPTTPSPCVCIPFWPCRCNPCWNMPCHNCHGCGWGK